MKWALALSLFIAGTCIYASIFAQDASDGELSIQNHRSYRDKLKVLQSLSPDDPNTDLVIDSLAADFLENDSFVSLNLLIKSGFLRKVRKNEQLQTQLILHLMKVGDSFGHVAKWREIYSYLDSLLPGQRVFLFLDALGNPIPNAEVQVFQQKSPRRSLEFGVDPPKASPRKLLLDQNGLLKTARKKWHRAPPRSFILSHPDYGIAVIDKSTWKCPCIYVPLVRSGSEADKYAIKGVVVDDANNPLAGVHIYCEKLITPGRGEVIWRDWYASVLTDQQGIFRMCMSVLKLKDGPERIPPGSRYKIGIGAPKHLQIRPIGLEIACGAKTVVRLERLELCFRTFVFEDTNGPITDPNLLDSILLYIKPPGMHSLTFTYAELKDGGQFPVGSYRAVVHERHKNLWFAFDAFEPMEVTEDTPPQLIFRRQMDRTVVYRGRAVYDFTDRPVPGALVVLTDTSPERTGLAEISAEQWQLLHMLAHTPSPNDPALQPLHRLWRIHKVVRTATDGRFQMAISYSDGTWRDHRFYVIEEGYMPLRHDTSHFENDPNEYIQLPTSRLFEAARVTFYVPSGQSGQEQVRMRVYFDRQNYPHWAAEFFSYCRIKAVSLPLNKVVTCNQRSVVSVPAELRMQLSFHKSPDWPTPVSTEYFTAERGQTLDLGRVKIVQRMPIYVHVVDSAGDPVEGVGVVHLEAERDLWFGEKHVTDAEGLAEFMVPPYYAGRFRVHCNGSFHDTPSETLSYETASQEDANMVYTLQLSDEMLQCLFK